MTNEESPSNRVEATTFDCSSVSPKVQMWCGLIDTYSQKYGLDPYLISALMLVESGGQPEIMSSAGAVGLMQIMPRDGISSTFQCINGPCFAGRPSIEELKDPEFNVDYGCKMLSGLLSKRGSVREALMAYGPSGVGYSYADKVISIRDSFSAAP